MRIAKMACVKALPLLLMLFAGCTASVSNLSAPRLTTAEERTEALETMQLVQTGVGAAHLAGKIDSEAMALIFQQLADIENTIERSEVEPVSWKTIIKQLAMYAAAWAIREKAPAVEKQ